MAAQKKLAAYPEAVALVFPPPPINGLGNASGFVFELQDKVGRTPQELAAEKDKMLQAMVKRPKLTNGSIGGILASRCQLRPSRRSSRTESTAASSNGAAVCTKAYTSR
jgi:multidrug efflux pump subunit AcrB